MQIPPMIYIFGELCNIILNVEKRRQISIAPKMTPQAILCYYLCRDLTSTKHFMYSLSTHTVVLANKIEKVPMELSTFKNPIVSTFTIASLFLFQLPPGHIDKSLLTTQKQVTVKQVTNIGVSY